MHGRIDERHRACEKGCATIRGECLCRCEPVLFWHPPRTSTREQLVLQGHGIAHIHTSCLHDFPTMQVGTWKRSHFEHNRPRTEQHSCFGYRVNSGAEASCLLSSFIFYVRKAVFLVFFAVASALFKLSNSRNGLQGRKLGVQHN